MSLKHELMKAVQNLPDEATPDQAEYHLAVALLLSRRLADTDRSKNLTLEEVRQRLRLLEA
jgi:hypothetical protein